MIRVNETTIGRLVDLCQQAINLDRGDQTQITNLQQQLSVFQQEVGLASDPDLNNRVTTLINAAMQVTPSSGAGVGGGQPTTGGAAPTDGALTPPTTPSTTPAATDTPSTASSGTSGGTHLPASSSQSPGDAGTATPATAPSTAATGGVTPKPQAPSGKPANP